MEEKEESVPMITEEQKKTEEEKKPEETAEYDKGMSISGFVKKELVDILLEYGFFKTVAEKSLYLTGGTSTEKAIEWIEKHQQDPDFEEELRIVGYFS